MGTKFNENPSSGAERDAVVSRADKQTVPELCGPTPGPMQWVPGVKRLEREAGHSPTPVAGLKNTWSYIFTPPSSWSGA